MTGRDERGRYVPGNEYAAIGGRARAERLTPAQRSAIARSGLQGLADKHFNGDTGRAIAWLSKLGALSGLFGTDWAREQMEV